MDRLGFHTLGAPSPLTLRRYPLSLDGEGEFRPTPSTKVLPTALHATTKGTQGPLPPQFSSGRLSPTRGGYADGPSGLRCLVLDDSTGRLPGRPPALNATKNGLRQRHRRRLP